MKKHKHFWVLSWDGSELEWDICSKCGIRRLPHYHVPKLWERDEEGEMLKRKESPVELGPEGELAPFLRDASRLPKSPPGRGLR